jgi:hypothetical protein
MSKEKILLYAFYAAAVVALIAFVVTKSETLMYFATRGMFDNGDLYRFTKVRFFKTPYPAPLREAAEEPQMDPDSADIILIGDSFMEICRGFEPFPRQLAERTGMAVYPVYAGQAPDYFDPVYFCWRHNLDPEKKRTIVLERVERYIINSYLTPMDEDTSSFRELAGDEDETTWEELRERWFTGAERNYEVLLSSSDVTSPLVEAWNTFRFSVFGYISDETPSYSLAPPFLFYEEETSPVRKTSFYYPHSDSLVEQIAGNIAAMRDSLKSEYNADLVFMPVPSAYTLYHTLINNDVYDDYLPRLCRRLEEKGVRTIPLYEKFRQSKEVLYFSVDTHWNGAGVKIALDQTLDALSGHLH